MNTTNMQQQKSVRADWWHCGTFDKWSFDRSNVQQTFTKEGFNDEHGHYVSWTWVITDIFPVKTKENVFMRHCNIVTRPQKMLSHCTMENQADSTPMFSRGLSQRWRGETCVSKYRVFPAIGKQEGGCYKPTLTLLRAKGLLCHPKTGQKLLLGQNCT